MDLYIDKRNLNQFLNSDMKHKPKKPKYRLKIDEIKKEDYIFGSILSPVPFEEINPSGDWTDDLPVRELQNRGFETYACVVFTLLHCVEILIKKKSFAIISI